jgi:hypothetical protein
MSGQQSIFDSFEDDEDEISVINPEMRPFDDPLQPPRTIEELRRRPFSIDDKIFEKLKDKLVLNVPEKLHPVSDRNAIYNQLSFVRDINYCFIKNQGIYFCIYGQGPLGLGKSSLAIQAMMQILGEYDYDGNLIKPCVDWDILHNYLIYHPLTFSKIIQHLEKTHKRIKALVWDDAGKYLYSKRWQSKQAQEIATWFQTARSHVASIIMTTPSPKLILGDIRKLCMVTTEVKFRNKSFGGFDSLYSADRRIGFS